MRRKSDNVLLKIESAVGKHDYDEALSLIEKNVAALFSSPNIRQFFVLIGNIPEERFRTQLQRLILGWVYSLCGDSGRMEGILEKIRPSGLSKPAESSLYYSLKAVSSFMEDPEGALTYAKLAAGAVEMEPDSFYTAAARMTYGQILSSMGEHRKAAREFFSAYHIFKKHKSYFPAVTALVNYGLKKHALGEISDIVTFFRNELTACSRYDCAFQMLKLPLGIAYFEMNRQKRAIRCLESIKELMYRLNFADFYGVLEMYLVYAYGISGLYSQAYELIDELAGRLSMLNFENVGTLCSALRAQVNLLEGVPVSDSDKKNLLSEYETHGRNTPIGTLLILARLKLGGEIDSFSMNDLISWEESPDTVKNIPFLQTAAILTAEYYYQLRETDYCREYLEKAAEIYTNCRLSARFLIEKAECLILLKEINRDLYRIVNSAKNKKRTPEALTPRELEILSLMAQGLSNSQISSMLCIGISTTKWHVNNILLKLHARRRSQAVAHARKLGLIP